MVLVEWRAVTLSLGTYETAMPSQVTPYWQERLVVAALVRTTVRLLLAIACALGVTSVIFAVWAATQTGTQLPPLALVLFVGVLLLFWISVIANTVITAGEIPKGQRDPISTNVALYRRFARRSSHQVRTILAIVWVVGSTLGATGIFTSTPIRLAAGVLLAFYGVIVAMLIALLPDPQAGDQNETLSPTLAPNGG